VDLGLRVFGTETILHDLTSTPSSQLINLEAKPHLTSVRTSLTRMCQDIADS